jgi:hypothetical protein
MFNNSMKKKRIMKIVLTFTSILIFVFSLHLPLYAAANNYYVTQNGSGTKNGLSLSNAWSVSDFNSSANWSAIDDSGKIDPGDTVYFSGLITTGLLPQGSGAPQNYITLDGYEADNIAFLNLSESAGRAKIDLTLEDSGIRLSGKSYITIQDFEITDCEHAIYVSDSSDWITIKRSYMYLCDRNGIYIGSGSLGVTIGGASGDGNVIKNIGVDTAGADVVLCDADNVIISYNHLYADNSRWGIDGVVPTCATSHDILIEYNSIHGHNHLTNGEDGIDLKDGAYNIIIRYNKISDHYRDPESSSGSPTGLKVNNADNVYIYGNWFENNETNLYLSNRENHDNIYVFSNLFIASEDSAISDNSAGFDANDHYYYNNTFSQNAYSPTNSNHTSLRINTNDGVIAKNNIIYKSRPNESDYIQVYLFNQAGDNTILDYNRYYWPGKRSKLFTNGSSGDAIGWFERVENHGSDGDPGLSNISNHGYTINPGAAIIGAGVDMGTGAITNISIQEVVYPVYWDVALGPNTDWSGIIPSIDVRRRDVVGWDIGAYAYAAGNLSQNKKLSSPSLLRVKN